MQTTRTLIFIAAVFTLLISACSQPEDLSAPTLAPQFGTADDDRGVDVATVSSGRVYTLSQRNGPYDQFGNYSSVFLQRQDSSGAVIWEKEIDWEVCDPDHDYYFEGSDCGTVKAVSLVADAQSNINVLTLYTYRGTSMDVDYETVSYGIYKYSASGQYVSSLSLIDYISEYGVEPGTVAFMVDASGNIFATHKVYSSEFDYLGSYVVAKYAPNGTRLWLRASPVGTPSDITVSSSGSVYVVGNQGMARYTNGGGLTWKKTGNFEEVIISGSNLYTRYRKDVRKYDGNGKQLWLKSQSGLSTMVLQSMDGDGSGNVYLSGKYDADSSSNLNMNAMVRKLNSSGSVLWTKTYGTSAYDDAKGIATITGSEIYTTGLTKGSLAHTNIGGEDGYLRKFSSSGGTVWTR